MVERFDRIVLAVPDMATAVTQYTALFGLSPALETTPTGDVAWWLLPNAVIEVVQSGSEGRIDALVFVEAGAVDTETACANSLGLKLYTGNGARTLQRRGDGRDGVCDALCVDHVVLRTGAADECVSLFRDCLGIRLALDKTVPQWGGRMLFFRAGKLTLEVIESEQDREADAGSHFWGIAYQCPDIDRAAAGMAGRGVTLSPVREGRKPGTRVATIQSHCLDIPTLLIEPARAKEAT